MILISGATGALGGIVTRGLLAKGYDVRILVRAGANVDALVAAGAQPITGDLKDAPSLARACAGVRTVVTTANSAARGGDDTVDSVDRHGNRALIDAAAAAGVQHFVFVSALGASADSPLDFLRAKAESEQHLRESGMSYTILQPDVFMDVWIALIVGMPLQQRRPVTLIGDGDHRHSFVALRDVAAFAVAAATEPSARGLTLVLGGPDALSWTDVVRAAEIVSGHKVTVQHLPFGASLEGFPDVVSQLANALETYETVLDTSADAARFGVRQTSVHEYLQTLLRPPVDA